MSRNAHLKSSLKMKLLNQAEATEIDRELFDDYKFSVDQLMELAGLSCAHAISKCYNNSSYQNILICCGPGNNGGDGLVCARHLTHLNYAPVIYYPKRTPKPLYENLFHQCCQMGIEIINDCPTKHEASKYNLIVDALFGFSFKPPVREEFVPLLDLMRTSKIPIASIDIPSGWHVERGPLDEATALQPDMLISLTAPKLCSEKFKGSHHYLGGRFVPKVLEEKYELELPKYRGTDLCIKL